MGNREFHNILQGKYPYALADINEYDSVYQVHKKIIENIGFREVHGSESPDVVTNEIIQFLENKHG